MESAPPSGPACVSVLVASGEFWRHVAFRRSLTKAGYSLIQAFEDLDSLPRRCSVLPDCIVIIGPDALEHLKPDALASVTASARTLVWGEGFADSRVQELIRAGCLGYFDPNSRSVSLPKCMRAIARDELWFGRRALSKAVAGLRSTIEAQRLTARERQVLDLAARGYKNRAIASALGITYDTVRWHLRSLHAKLGSTARPHAE